MCAQGSWGQPAFASDVHLGVGVGELEFVVRSALGPAAGEEDGDDLRLNRLQKSDVECAWRKIKGLFVGDSSPAHQLHQT